MRMPAQVTKINARSKKLLCVAMALASMSACSSAAAPQRLQVGEQKQFSEELWELPGGQFLAAVRALSALRGAHPEIRMEEFLVSYTANSDNSVYIGFYKPSASMENKQTGEVTVQKNSIEHGVVVVGETVRVVR